MTLRQARRLLAKLGRIGAEVPRWSDYVEAVRLVALAELEKDTLTG